jgi:hypothetical protein
MSDTPETDLLCGEVVPAKFARRLERERNHLLAALEGMVLLFEGESGTGADYWEQYAAYKAAKAAISKAKGEA